MSNQKIQKPTLTGQRFKTRKRDEKKVFDPTQFQETIVQGLNQTGSDLDAVAKFLDASGAKLDYRRYAETLFDILVAGGMLGVSAAFAVKLFKSWIHEKDINSVAGSLRKVGMDNRLLELFPANKRSCEHFSKYFTDAGLKELSDFARNQQAIGSRKELQKELQEQMERGDAFKDIIASAREEMKKNNISEQTMIGIVWTSVMSYVEWNKKEELVTEQAIKHLKQYSPLLKAFTSQGASEILLLNLSPRRKRLTKEPQAKSKARFLF
ncbi:unnamed protein product [Coregonus sp. 'balchen']|nr:unnamed protein product [Coregonus sp. 'balchen']